MFGLGLGEVLVILVIALIFLGPKKLPELAKGLGKGMREFQNAMKGMNEEFKNASHPEEKPPAQIEQKPISSHGVKEDEKDKKSKESIS